MNYYIADMHLGHYNIMTHSNRPFKTIEEMDKTILNNFSRITENDDIYFLGDMCMKLTDNIIEQIKSIKGRKHLIVGNHDKKYLRNPKFRELFVSIKDLEVVHDNDKTIILCHYPLVEWDGFYRGSYHFYGHIHNNDNDANRIMKTINNAYNVGVDILDFMPKTANEIIKNK